MTRNDLTGKRYDGTLVFTTAHSEKRRKTKLDDCMGQVTCPACGTVLETPRG